MKIAYDAKRAMQNFTGLGNYSRTLLETLATYYPQHQYQLFVPRDTQTSRIADLRDQKSVSIYTPFGAWPIMPALWRTAGIVRDIKKQDAQIFHGLSHELPVGLQRAGIRSVVTMHDLVHERYPEFYPALDRRIYTIKFRHACRTADSVVAISEQTRRDLIELYQVPPHKITVIYQSCHPQFGIIADQQNIARIKKKYQLPNQYILYVGTINERKNLLGLIQALENLTDTQPELHLVIAGIGGTYAQKIQTYLDKRPHLNARIKWLPKQDFPDMPAVYQGAHALVLPSFYEGFGIPVIEALSGGTPVITSQGGCLAEAGGPNSLYINPADPTDIAAAIHHVVTNPTLRDQMRTVGLQHVQKFAPKSLADQWITHYQSIL